MDRHTRLGSIREHLTRQHGVISYEQLRGVGLTSSGVAAWQRSGRLVRIHPRVYVAGHRSMNRRGEMHAALLSAGVGAVLTGFSTLELRRIVPVGAHPIEVLVARRWRGVSGAVVHHTRRPPTGGVITRDGLPCTTVARALVDMSARLDRWRLANIMHEAAFRRCLNVRELRAEITKARHVPGHAELVRAFDMHLRGSAGTRSQLERRFLALLSGSQMELPETNVSIRVGAATIEVDAVWRRQRVCVEVDGHGHARARTRRADADRDLLLGAAGYVVVRVTADELELDPRSVVGRLREALGGN